jgi:hypothetical protein
VDVAQLLVDKLGSGLAGQVQDRRSGKPRLDQAGHGIGGTGAGAADGDAELAGRSRKSIGHVAGAHFSARHDEPDGIPAADRVEHGDVVDRHHAEGGGNATIRQELRDQVADVVVAHCLTLTGVASGMRGC